jgi:hypothetical protein
MSTYFFMLIHIFITFVISSRIFRFQFNYECTLIDKYLFIYNYGLNLVLFIFKNLFHFIFLYLFILLTPVNFKKKYLFYAF